MKMSTSATLTVSSFQTDVEEALADWDERFRAWRLGDSPITEQDEWEAAFPTLSNATFADFKRRRLRPGTGCVRLG